MRRTSVAERDEKASRWQYGAYRGILMRTMIAYRYDREARRTLAGRDKADRSERNETTKNEKRIGFQKKDRKEVLSYSEDPDQDVFLVPPLPVHDSVKTIPIKRIANGIIEMADGRYVKILQVTPVNLVFKGQAEQHKVMDRFFEMLRICPVNIHIKSIATPLDLSEYLAFLNSHMTTEKNWNCRYLDLDQIRFIEEYARNEGIKRRFLIMLEYASDRRVSSPDKEMMMAAHELEAVAGDVEAYLKRCGNDVIHFENETQEVVELLYGFFNRRSSEEISLGERLSHVHDAYLNEYGPHSISMIPVTDYMAPSKVEFFDNYTVMDGKYYSWLYIAQDSYPELVSPSWTSFLTNMGDEIDVDFYISRERLEDSRRRLERRMRLKSVNMSSMNPEGDNYNEELNKLDAGAYLQMGVRNEDHICYVSTLLTVIGNTKEEMEYKVGRIKVYAKAHGMRFHSTLLLQKEAYFSSMPFNMIHKSIARKASQNVLTSDLSAWYPFSSYDFCNQNGLFIGLSKWNRAPVIADIFRTPEFSNANVSIMGATGAGKTYLLLALATRFRRQHIKTMMLIPDKSHEYKRACDAIGGEFISLGPQSGNCINVFEIRQKNTDVNELLDGGSIYRSFLAEKIESLHIWLSLRIRDVTELESEAFDAACLQAYKDKGITEDNESLYDPFVSGSYRCMPTFSDVYRHLLDEEHGQRIASILKREVSGSASVYNGQTNVDFDNDFVVFQMDGLRRSDLLASTAYSVIELMFERAKENRTEPVVIIMDELWSMIGLTANPKVAEQILEIFKTIRGYGAAAIYATQSVGDHDTNIGRSILNACKTKIILPVEEEEGRSVQKLLGLSEYEYNYITTSTRGNALFCAGQNNIPVTITASPLEHSLFTTDRTDLENMYHEKMAEMEG